MSKKFAASLTLGTAVAAALALAPVANAAENPFAIKSLDAGYKVAAADKSKEGKCGEGKCGAHDSKSKEGKCGEGKCGAADSKSKEGKCGEGKCGAHDSKKK